MTPTYQHALDAELAAIDALRALAKGDTRTAHARIMVVLFHAAEIRYQVARSESDRAEEGTR